MAEDDNTRLLELIILIQGAGCSQSSIRLCPSLAGIDMTINL